MSRATYVCVPDLTPGPRSECPDVLHDHPLPSGYLASSEVADERLSKGWRNRKCRRCGLYGWTPPAGWSPEDHA